MGIALHGSLRHTTTMDGGSADIAYAHGWALVEQCRSNCRGANICPYIHGHSSLLVFTHMDVGYEDNAGAIIFPWHRDIPYILYIRHSLPSMAPRHTVHPWHRRTAFHGSLRHTVHPWTFVTPCHPWHRDIPYILYIKKPSE